MEYAAAKWSSCPPLLHVGAADGTPRGTAGLWWTTFDRPGASARPPLHPEPALRHELRRLARLALPVMAAQVGGMLIGVVDTMMVGRLSVDALAAAAIANAVIHGLLLVGQGVIFGIDPIVSQAHGAQRPHLAAEAMQRGVLLSLAVSVPLALLLGFTEEVLLALGQAPALAAEAQRYTVVQIPSVPCFLVFMAIRQWLQGREIVRPPMWIMLVANVFNAAANYVLIFGVAGWAGHGLLGAGIATALTRSLIAFALIAWVYWFRLHEGSWSTPGWHLFDRAEFARILRVGGVVAAQLAFEVWAFTGSTLIAGWLDPVSLAAHTVALNLASLAFMMPLGISQGAVARVGNLIGAGHPLDAQRAAKVAMMFGGGVMTISAVLFVTLREWLPRLYTDDPLAIAACAAVLPIAAAFQIFDGIQVVGCGVLRGMGHTRPAAIFNFIGYWIVGLPLGVTLAFRFGFGLSGVWIGLAAGLLLVATALSVYIARRGPAHVRTVLSS